MSLETVEVLFDPDEFDAVAAEGGFPGGADAGAKAEFAVIGLLRRIGFPEARHHNAANDTWDVYTSAGYVEVKSHLSTLHPATPVSTGEFAQCKFLCKVWSDLSSGYAGGLIRNHPKLTFYIRLPTQRIYVHYDERLHLLVAYS